MNALQKARQYYRDGAHTEAIEFITSDPELRLRRPLVEEVAYNLCKTQGNPAGVEYLLEQLPNFPGMYPRWTRMMAHWSINTLEDARAAEICDLAISANSTHAQRLAMTGALYFRMFKLFTRLGRSEAAIALANDGFALGFHECVFLEAATQDHSRPTASTWALYRRLVAAGALSGEIWAGVANWINPGSATGWLTLLSAHAERLDEFAGYHRTRARVFQCLEQYECAILALKRALELRVGDLGTIWNEIAALYLQLEPSSGTKADRRIALCNAVVHNPSNRLSLEALKADFLRENPAADLHAELGLIQAAHDRVILTVFFELRTHEPLDSLLRRFKPQFDAEKRQPRYEDCERLWGAFVEGNPLPSITPPDNNTVKIFIISLMQGVARVNIARNWADDRAAMKASRINTRSLRALHASLATEIDADWRAYLDSVDFPNAEAKETVFDRETACSFQNRIINSGQFNLPDLAKTGQDVGVVDSFYTNGRNVFTFAGDSPFIFVTAGAGSRPFMLYYPREKLIVDLGARLGHMLDDFHMNNLLSRYITRLAEHTIAYDSARATVRTRAGKFAQSAPPRKITLNINTAENFAHHVWNFYTGLERQLRFGTMHNVAAIHFSGTEFFGALKDIFPEISRFSMGTARIEGNVDPVPFDPDALLLTPGGYFISQAMQDRIARVCALNVQKDRAALARLQKVRGASRVVWFGLRTGDKSWLGQEAGLVRIISYLQAEFEDVICVLDAFSLPANQSSVPAVWQSAFDQLSALCDRIVDAVPRKGDVLNLTGVSLPETILIARETDAYVTPLGTTQHKVGWFTKGPGLVYVSKAVGELDIMRRPGTWESEGISLPDFLVADREFAGTKRDVNDRRAHLSNMELDTDKICRWLKDRLTAQNLA